MAWPLVFTGLLLDEPDMYNFWINNPNKRTSRGHEKLYYIGDRSVSVSSDIVPPGQTWVGWQSSGGKYPAFSKQTGQEYEHLHPSEWLCYKPHCKSEVYRTQHDVYSLLHFFRSVPDRPKVSPYLTKINQGKSTLPQKKDQTISASLF